MKIFDFFPARRGLRIGLLLLALLPALRAQPYPRWMAIGNSITQHGPKASLQWEGEIRGMAASSPENDYVHQLRALLQKRDPANAAELKIVGRLGRLSAGTIEKIGTVLDELNTWNADLVTLQLGENDNLKDLGAEGFERRYRAVVDGLLAGPKKPVIVCTGVWAPGSPPAGTDTRRYPPGSGGAIKEAIIEKICREKGLRFASLAPCAQNPKNRGDGRTPGVQWHPNDAGMKAYAEALCRALYPEPGQAAAP